MVDLKLPKQRVMISPALAWKRFLAFFIDILIIQFVIIMPFANVITEKVPVSENFTQNYEYFNTHPEVINQLVLVFGIIFFLIFVYFVIFEYKMKQTPGKIALNLYLQPVDKNEPLTFGKILLRNLALLPIFPLYLLWIIDPLYLIFTGRRLSDIISKTQIVEEINLYE
jgi:uncharacterized RDD family membrane protein YckC